ncbi:MAG TPA: glycosyltransferase [Candidatus Limnocylindria bacterium]
MGAIRAATSPPEEVIVIDAPRGAGPAEARNLGARRAAGDILVFVDSDVAVHANVFGAIREHFDDPGLAAVFGSYDDSPSEPGNVSAFRNLLHHHVHQDSPGAATTFWAGLGAVRREAFLAAGEFDALRFPSASIEDIEFGMRLAERGARIELDPGLLGTHLKRWRLAQMIRTDLLDRGVPWVLLLLRSRRASSALNLGWRHRLSAVLAIVGTAAVVRRRVIGTAAVLSILVALNRSFYALLWRRLGPPGAALGVLLHVLHHLTAAAAVPYALAVYARDRYRVADCRDLVGASLGPRRHHASSPNGLGSTASPLRQDGVRAGARRPPPE